MKKQEKTSKREWWSLPENVFSHLSDVFGDKKTIMPPEKGKQRINARAIPPLSGKESGFDMIRIQNPTIYGATESLMAICAEARYPCPYGMEEVSLVYTPARVFPEDGEVWKDFLLNITPEKTPWLTENYLLEDDFWSKLRPPGEKRVSFASKKVALGPEAQLLRDVITSAVETLGTPWAPDQDRRRDSCDSSQKKPRGRRDWNKTSVYWESIEDCWFSASVGENRTVRQTKLFPCQKQGCREVIPVTTVMEEEPGIPFSVMYEVSRRETLPDGVKKVENGGYLCPNHSPKIH